MRQRKPADSRRAASVGKSRAAVLRRRERRRSSSASDDEIGGFLARLREQLYRKDDDMREVVDGVIQIAIGYVNA